SSTTLSATGTLSAYLNANRSTSLKNTWPNCRL
ncbi:uncharacterized protein METZ01_LOCUS189705, partial [marine metagenome]